MWPRSTAWSGLSTPSSNSSHSLSTRSLASLVVAVPRTSVEPPRTEVAPPKEGLSVQTLIIAAIASGIAAVVVSHFWARGTILFSAMTPVAVALISELLRKPVESERLRSGVRSVSSAARPPSFSRPRSGRTPKVMPPPTPGVEDGLRQREEGLEAGPVRVYSSGTNKRPRGLNGTSPRRRLHLKIAIVTGLVAFVIAALALTLPELIFGGSVGGGGGKTTYFGGGSDTSSKGESQDGSSDGQSDEPTQQDSGSSSGGNQDQPSGDSGSDQPDSTTPQTTPPDSGSTAPAPAPTPAPTPSAPSTPSP
jgi:uncharacterized membrane protein YvlD (DUF360 family)